MGQSCPLHLMSTQLLQQSGIVSPQETTWTCRSAGLMREPVGDMQACRPPYLPVEDALDLQISLPDAQDCTLQLALPSADSVLPLACRLRRSGWRPPVPSSDCCWLFSSSNTSRVRLPS